MIRQTSTRIALEGILKGDAMIERDLYIFSNMYGVERYDRKKYYLSKN